MSAVFEKFRLRRPTFKQFLVRSQHRVKEVCWATNHTVVEFETLADQEAHAPQHEKGASEKLGAVTLTLQNGMTH